MAFTRTWIAFIIGVFSLLLVATAQSTPLAIKRLALQQGLSQSTVYAIVQDSIGYIWFGTADGIDIYDGQEFRHIRHNPEDKTSLSGNYVRSLLVSRNGIVWVGTLGGGLNRYNSDTQTFSVYRKGGDNSSLMSDDIHCLFESTDGNIWIGSDAGVSRFNPENNSFTHYTSELNNQSTLQKGVIRAITQTRDGLMWFASADDGISSFDPLSGGFYHYRHKEGDTNSLSNDAINAIHQDQKGVLWVATEYGGLNKLDLNSGEFTSYQKQSGKDGCLNDNEITAIYEDKKGFLWLGTWSGGLNRFDPAHEKFKNYRTSPANSNSLSSDSVISLFEDHSGMLWAGTFDSGVNVISYQGGNIDNFGFDPLQKDGLIDKMVWSFSEDQAGQIWVGTKKGLSRFDPVADIFSSYLAAGNCVGATDSIDIRSIVSENDHLWLGTAGGGLINFNPTTCAVRNYKHDAEDATSLSNNHVRLLLKDRQNRLWIGTSDGLNSLSSKHGAIKRYSVNPRENGALPHKRIRALYQADNGDIWIGTSGGLSRYSEETDSFSAITSEQGLLSDNDVRSVYQDAGGILWIATGVGLTRYDPQQQTARFFYEKDGLSNNTLYSLIPDGNYLWITTNIGLSRFDRSDYSFKNFDVGDGLQSNEFNFNAYLKTDKGEFYVGGVNGFNRFIPRNLGANVTPPKLQLEIGLLDKDNRQSRVSIADPSKPLQLRAFDQRITFHATVLHYLNPQKNTLEYQLKGFDTNWMIRQAFDKKITYPSLPSGEYLFQVRAVSSSGVPSTMMISQALSVKPSLWKTGWAFLLYVLLFFVVIFLAMQLRTITLRRRTKFLEDLVKDKTIELQQKNETLENQSKKLSMLMQNQDDFYLRTAHELRTPLSLIRIPVEQLSLGEQPADKTGNIDIILRATARLQRLIDQMLQAAIHGRTHEAGVQTIDLKAVIAPLLEVYAEIAERKAITFGIAPIPAAAITLNRQAIEDIIHNLLNNALKYTPNGGRITVTLTLVSDEVNCLLLCVKDTGIGIDSNSKARIFDRLYRGEKACAFEPQGEGVGLHIVKQHVEACGGNLDFSSEPGQGSEFRVRIPCQWTLNDSEWRQSDKPLLAKHPDLQWRSDGKQSLLIIEDDDDMQQILRSLLEDTYQVVFSGSASQGLLKARELMPDLVLCDVMLPDGSGFDIIRSLKNNEDTGQIPLILLTAVGDLKGKKTGWENGADDYIVKPFSSDDLLLRIAGLLANRKRLQEWYQHRFLYNEDNGKCKNEKRTDLDYLEKLEVQTLILLDNGNCSLENLASAMGLSGRTLQRRLKSILNFSYTEYTQSIQLKKARQLLRGGSSVKEAAFAAGFSDPAYFSKVFKSLHGVSPSQYRSNTPEPIESRQ